MNSVEEHQVDLAIDWYIEQIISKNKFFIIIEIAILNDQKINQNSKCKVFPIEREFIIRVVCVGYPTVIIRIFCSGFFLNLTHLLLQLAASTCI